MADVGVKGPAQASAPLTYKLADSAEFIPRTIKATFDGASATSAFYPCLVLKDAGGLEVVRIPTGITVAAGGSAEVTWFPGAELEEAQATTTGVIVETLFLDMTVGTVTASTVLESGVQYSYTIQGTFIYYDHPLDVGTPESAAMFPTSSAGRVSTQVGLDAETVFARYSSASGPGLGHYNLLMVDLGSGAQHIDADGGPYSTPQDGHFYTYTVTGQGSAPTFSFPDTVYSDNYGKLRIAIQTLAATGTPGGGGTGTGSYMPDPSSASDGSWLRTTGGAAVWEPTPQVTEADQSLSDVTTLDVSTSRHGYAPKAPNDSTKYLDGTGAYSTPSGSTSPLTTKGDLYGYSTTDARVPIGTDGDVLTADSTQTLGLKWAAASAAGVSSLDSITGAITLIAGANVAITDNSPSAGDITIAATPGAGGFQVVAYTEFTSNASITATTEGGANTVVTASSFSADGTSAYLIQAYSAKTLPDTGASARAVLHVLYLDGSSIGIWGVSQTPSSGFWGAPTLLSRRLVPSSGSRTFSWRAYVNAGTGLIQAGAGGSGNTMPGYIMVTKLL